MTSDPYLRRLAPDSTYLRRVREFERQLVLEAVEEASGNVTKAAQALGISRKGLYHKIGQLEIAEQVRAMRPEPCNVLHSEKADTHSEVRAVRGV